MGFDEATLERFWSKVDKSGGSDACWEWKAAINKKDGYGRFCCHIRSSYAAHRYSYLVANPTINIMGKLICHTCDNRKCVNPAHLYAGNAKTNIMDCITRGRWKLPPTRTGKANHNSKLTESQVAYIKLLIRHGYGRYRLAQWYCVGVGAIAQIMNGKAWKYVEPAEMMNVGEIPSATGWSRRGARDARRGG